MMVEFKFNIGDRLILYGMKKPFIVIARYYSETEDISLISYAVKDSKGYRYNRDEDELVKEITESEGE